MQKRPHWPNISTVSFLHKKKRTTHRPAFDQNVWNFTLKPDLGCGHLCFNRVYFFFSKAKWCVLHNCSDTHSQRCHAQRRPAFLSFPFDVWQREQISWLVLPYPISSFLPFLTTLWRLKDTGWLTSYKVCKLGLQIISLTCLLNSHLLYTFLLYTFWPFLGQKYKDD